MYTACLRYLAQSEAISRLMLSRRAVAVVARVDTAGAELHSLVVQE